MNGETNVKNAITDSLTPMRSQILRVGNKHIITPLKSIDLKKITRAHSLYNERKSITEMYREITPKIVSDVDSSNEIERQFTQKVDAHYNKARHDLEITLFFLRFKSPSIPSDKEIEFITDAAYSYSDITPIPAIERYPQKEDPYELEQYFIFLNSCIATIRQLNKKPIMGILPANLPRNYFRKIIPFYLNEGINSFYFDFEGKTLNPLSIREILRILNSNKILENSFLYAINANIGKTRKDTNIIPAKDFLTIGYGFDSVGEQHIRAKKPIGFYKQFGPIKYDKIRIFNKENYGYHRIDNKEEIKESYPLDAGMNLDELFSDKKNNSKVFNMQQQLLESKTLQSILTENAEKGVVNYLETKKFAKDDLPRMILTKKNSKN